MKSRSSMHSRTAVLAFCAIAFASGIITFPARADQWDKLTRLTVHQTIQIRDTVLEPGQYTLKLASSSSNRNIVQIFNGDQSRIVDTVLAIPKYRTEPSGDTQFSFWETPPGTARAMRTWFYPGDTVGQEFPYPKRLTQLAMAAPPPPSLPERETTPPPPPPAAAEPAPAPEPQATTVEPEQQPATQPEQPVQMAQNEPPPAAPAEPETAAPTAPNSEPARQLPKTASPYPLIGLAGLSMLGLYGALRTRRAL